MPKRSPPLDVVELVEARQRAHQRIVDGSARAIRLRAGVSLRALGQQIGTTGQAILHWERGEHEPRDGRTAHAWVEILDRLEALLDGEPELPATGTDGAGS